MEADAGGCTRQDRSCDLGDLRDGLEKVTSLRELGWWLGLLVRKLSNCSHRPVPRGGIALGQRRSRALIPLLGGTVEALFRGLLSVSSWETLAVAIQCQKLGRAPDCLGEVLESHSPWELACLAGCNLLAGHHGLIPEGSATAVQKHAAAELQKPARKERGTR